MSIKNGFEDIEIIVDPSLPPNTSKLVDVSEGHDESVIQTYVPRRGSRPWPPFGGGLSREEGTLLRAGMTEECCARSFISTAPIFPCGFHELAVEWLHMSKEERDVVLDFAKSVRGKR